jgi:hypothetical protein
MASKQISKVFFINGSSPTAEDRASAEKLEITAFRNATFINEGDNLEAIIAGAGAIPAAYLAVPGFKILDAKPEPVKAPEPVKVPHPHKAK